MRRFDPDALDGLFDAIHGSVGQCRFEATTLRTTGLAVPAIRAAVERLHGRSLLREHLLRAHGIIFGRLTVGAYQLLSQRTIVTEWTSATRWRLLFYSGSQWVTFAGAHEPAPTELPPRIDHLVGGRLSHRWFPLHGQWLLARNAWLSECGCTKPMPDSEAAPMLAGSEAGRWASP